MDLSLASMGWQDRIATAPLAASLAVLVVGECCLVLELIGRVFGTYVPSLLRIAVRTLLVALACFLLAIPFLVALSLPDDRAGLWLLLSSLVNLLVILHLLFPYRFGIRTLDRDAGTAHQRPLAPGIVLRPVAVETALPPGSGGSLRCLVLSDLHCTRRSSLDRLRAAAASLAEPRYDLVFALGDMGEDPALLPEVMRLVASLRPAHGVYCVRGNHDFERGRPELIADLAKEHGIVLLANASHVVPGLGVEIIGLECPWECRRLPSPARGPFAIGLTHTPDNIKVFSRLNVPLVLAGHTHGGKLRLPWIGSLPVGSRFGRFLDEGWFQFADTRLYITPGIRHFPGLFGKQGVIVDLNVTDPAGTPQA